MDVGQFLVALLLVSLASVVIKFACDSFEEASNYLGRNLAAGIKGATINAVGSSMPELLTTTVFLFLYRDLDGFSAGVATAAGSAVFNGLIIPALCIFVVAVWGIRTEDGHRRVSHIEVDSRTVLRDGIWLVVAEVTLIVLLGNRTLTWVAGATLLACYLGYLAHLAHHNRTYRSLAPKDEGGEENDVVETASKSQLRALLTLDFNRLLFAGRPLSAKRAWILLGASVLVLAAACTLLAEAVVLSAEALAVPTYFTAVVLAAAATSIPDTILSIKDARNGHYDDAVSNAFGSNIFDIAVALGLPLLLYSLVYGDVTLSVASGSSAAEVQVLRIVLLWISVLIISLFLAGRRAGLGKATALLALYAGWMAWIADSAFRLGIFAAV